MNNLYLNLLLHISNLLLIFVVPTYPIVCANLPRTWGMLAQVKCFFLKNAVLLFQKKITFLFHEK